MKIEEIKKILEQHPGSKMTVSIAPVITVDNDDRAAMALIEWLMDYLGDEGTMRQAMGAISAAEWWLLLWASEISAKRLLETGTGVSFAKSEVQDD